MSCRQRWMRRRRSHPEPPHTARSARAPASAPARQAGVGGAASRQGAGAQGVAGGRAARQPSERVGAAIRPRQRTPQQERLRRLLLGGLSLLALLLLLLLLLHHGHDDARRPGPPPRVVSTHRRTGPGRGLGGVGMPVPAGGTIRVRPIDLVVSLGPRIDDAVRRRELAALGSWMERNHRSASRVTILDGGRATRPLPAARLERDARGRPRSSVSALVLRALRRRRGRTALLVRTGGAARLPVPAGSAVLEVDGVPGGPNPRRLGIGPGAASAVDVDLRRRNALAAVVARAVMAVSRQRER
jgi:hypothetical protein